MKLFGEYLVDQKLLTEDQLLAALIFQIEEQPSLAKLSRDLGLLSAHEILQVLKHQTAEQTSFLASATQLSLWNSDKTETLVHEMATQRTPLGEILVRNKVLDIAAITQALDQFFADKGRKNSSLPKAK